jgi:hypothetical protein
MDNKIKTSNDYSICNLTDYGRGLEPNVDARTNYGKEYATMEQVEAVNKAFYDALMNSLQEEEQHKHRR